MHAAVTSLATFVPSLHDLSLRSCLMTSSHDILSCPPLKASFRDICFRDFLATTFRNLFQSRPSKPPLRTSSHDFFCDHLYECFVFDLLLRSPPTRRSHDSSHDLVLRRPVANFFHDLSRLLLSHNFFPRPRVSGLFSGPSLMTPFNKISSWDILLLHFRTSSRDMIPSSRTSWQAFQSRLLTSPHDFFWELFSQAPSFAPSFGNLLARCL